MPDRGNDLMLLQESVTYEKDLHTLLAKADCVALSLPLNANTKGFFDSSKFNAMKDGAILVNTARGGVLDEEAMISALESGKVGRVASMQLERAAC